MVSMTIPPYNPSLAQTKQTCLHVSPRANFRLQILRLVAHPDVNKHRKLDRELRYRKTVANDYELSQLCTPINWRFLRIDVSVSWENLLDTTYQQKLTTMAMVLIVNKPPQQNREKYSANDRLLITWYILINVTKR